MKLRNLITALLLGMASMVMADEYIYLNVDQNDGGETSFTVSEIRRITFDADHMIVTLNDGTTQQLPLAGLSKMFFSATPTGINAMSAVKNAIRLADGTLHVDAPAGTAITLYDMRGQTVKTIVSTGDDTQLNVGGLTRGVYIVKVGRETKKIMNR